MTTEKTKVLVVDDSAVIRAIISRTLQQVEGVEIIGTAGDGVAAIEKTREFKPDVIILDIEMPVMDGITALPQLLQANPGVLILICSTLSARGTEISLKALSLGAADCILKPGGESITTAFDFQETLKRTITSLKPAGGLTSAKPATLIQRKRILPPRVLALCSSTGGPKALEDVLKGLRGLPIPIVLTQHMPPAFTALLAKNLQQMCGLPCFEGQETQILEAGSVYIAPGGKHMTFRKLGNDVMIHLTDEAPENYCKPSADPMLRSLADIYGSRIQAGVLTGMGADGLAGCRCVVEEGGQVIAQDKETSAVWGMPGAVAEAGLCSAILPLPEISAWLRHAITGQRAA